MKSGDIVRLKTGGPLMIVRYALNEMAAEATGKEVGAHCDWHDDQGRPQWRAYDPGQLEVVNPADISPGGAPSMHSPDCRL